MEFTLRLEDHHLQLGVVPNPECISVGQRAVCWLLVLYAGNKADLESSRAVSAEEATTYANENGLFFMETSAKTAANVNELFTEIARKLPKAEAPRQQQPGIVLDAQPQPQAARKISSCC
eukprot:GHUV01045257.1.p2 GENE.GHUV01045257.1~~GHUV01045257.1.p2  ORF type:complete len:120 (-),score=39.06 GHUV01045257.1:362-721(-)